MLILSLDSAGSGCSVCVWRDGEVLAAAHEEMNRGQDQRLIPLILEVMKQANVDFPALDRIAVTRGPGSFTGLRIGLAAARGMGLASAKPVIGIDRFAIYREAFKDTPDLLVVLESRRAELYCRFYPANAATHEPVMWTRDEIENFLVDRPSVVVVGDSNGVPPSLTPPARGGEPHCSFQNKSHNDEDVELKLKKNSNSPPPLAGGVRGGGHPQALSEVMVCARLAALADTNNPDHLPRPLYLRAPDVTFPPGIEVLRKISADDATLLAALHKDAFGAAAWSHDQIAGSLAQPTTQGWLAQRGTNPVGFILLQVTPGECEILTIGVRTAHQKRGIGERLLKQAMQAVGGKLFLEVADDNPPARRLYEKLGFQQTGRRANYYRRGSTAVDAVLYTIITKGK